MSRVAELCARITGARRFETVTFGVILLNAVVLALETYGDIARAHGGLLSTLNYLFLGYFVIEMAIRLGAHGRAPWRLFRSGWNAFDFVVIAAAFMPGVRENATALRLVRLLRVFRLISVLPELRVLVVGLVRSLTPLASVGFLFLILFYVYGMVGWLSFHDEDPKNWSSIGQAMLTLFTILTLEEWVTLQRDALEITPWAPVYFVSFILISSFLLLNMVIAVIINSVDEARRALAHEQRRELAAKHADEAALLDRLDDLRDALAGVEAELEERFRRSRRRSAP
jgi:voltage-gated sodium channel